MLTPIMHFASCLQWVGSLKITLDIKNKSQAFAHTHTSLLHSNKQAGAEICAALAQISVLKNIYQLS